MLQSPQPPPTETVLTALLNEIATCPDRLIVVLDDYHLIDAQPIHDALIFLLEHLPSQMHLDNGMYVVCIHKRNYWNGNPVGSLNLPFGIII